MLSAPGHAEILLATSNLKKNPKNEKGQIACFTPSIGNAHHASVLAYVQPPPPLRKIGERGGGGCTLAKVCLLSRRRSPAIRMQSTNFARRTQAITDYQEALFQLHWKSDILSVEAFRSTKTVENGITPGIILISAIGVQNRRYLLRFSGERDGQGPSSRAP